MATTQEYVNSIRKGIHKLTAVLDSLDTPACETCGHGHQLNEATARSLDKLVWEALHFAEGRR